METFGACHQLSLNPISSILLSQNSLLSLITLIPVNIFERQQMIRPFQSLGYAQS